MPNAEKVNCDKCQGTGTADFAGFGLDTCRWCDGKGTIEQSSIVEHPFSGGDVHLCWACGALPCDGGVEAWRKLPWVVTKKESGGWRFLIDSRDPENRDMFSGFYIRTDGRLGEKMQRYNYHRSHFEEELPN